MDCVPLNETLSNLLINYGSLILFLLLILGIVALPIPEETLMIFAGVLMSKGILHILPTVLAAYAGSICGITFSYLLGKTVGIYLIHKYGGWIGITEKQLNSAKNWFHHFGKWALFIGYFIPGVRHFTGFSAGTSNLEFRPFALFAFSGAILWSSTFLSIGYFFNKWCAEFFETLEISGGTLVTIGIIVLLIGSFIFHKCKNKQLK